MSIAPPYKQSTASGWPLCPQCHEDELFCTSWPATVEKIEGCYLCNWKPAGAPRTPSPNRSV